MCLTKSAHEAINTFTPTAGNPPANIGVQLLVTPTTVCPICREQFKLGDPVSFSTAFAFARNGERADFRILRRGNKVWWMTCTRPTCLDRKTQQARPQDGIWNGDLGEDRKNCVLLKEDPTRPQVFMKLAGEGIFEGGHQTALIELE